MPTQKESLARSLTSGIASGAVAAVIAALVSLPLRSPDDAFFNTASVVIGCLLAGLGSGFLWHSLASFKARYVTFVACLVAVFIIVAAISFAMDAMPDPPLAHIPGFVVPLAAVSMASLAILQPYFFKVSRLLISVAAGATVAALTVGVALAGQGDGESGTLSLSDLPTVVPIATATRTPSQTATAQVLIPSVSPAFTLTTSTPAPMSSPKASGAYVVVSAESSSTYTVHEKLSSLPLPSDAVGHTNSSAITGEIYLDGHTSKVVVDLRTLESDQSRRDNYIRNQGGIQSSRYPYSEFTATDVAQLAAELQKGGPVTGKLSGTMKIREVEKPFTFDIEARMGEGVIQIHGTAEFTWADFNIPPPNVRGIVQVEDKVKIEVLLVAKQA